MTHTPHPLRFQRKRTKGWRMPPGGVCCTRPGPWGNPGLPVEEYRALLEALVLGKRHECQLDLNQLATVNWQANHIHDLRGKPLGCFCGLDQPCHVDVICELANPEVQS